MNCPICKHQHSQAAMELYDDRYGYPGRFTLMKCNDCEHLFLNCNLTPRQLTELYTNYYPRKSLDISTYKPYTEQSGFLAWFNGLSCSAFRWIPPNVRVLDVGCGFGESLGYHAARGCDVYGVEADENIRRVVEKYGYKVHVGLFDDEIYAQDFFDFVTMDQVIEHVTDPIATLRGVARILKPGATVILTTPNALGWGARLFGGRWINWHAPYHLHFYSRKSMEIVSEAVGLQIESVRTITSSEWLFYQWLHLITYPRYGHPSEFWAKLACGDSADMGFGKSTLVALVKVLHRTKINHLITRLFDGLGMGDSQTFVLTKR